MSDTVEKVASLAYQMGQMQLMLDNQKQTIENQNQRLEADTASLEELKRKLGVANNDLATLRQARAAG